MYQRNALTLKELQSIRSLTDRPVEAAETLLDIIMEQPDAVYLCFLDVLKHTEQLHIYQRLVEDAYIGKYLGCYGMSGLSLPAGLLNKSSAVTEMGDRLATIDMGRKLGSLSGSWVPA